MNKFFDYQHAKLNSFILFFVLKVLGILSSYVLTFSIVKFFGIAALGEFTFLLASLVFVQLISKLGTEIYLMKEVAKNFENDRISAKAIYLKLVKFLTSYNLILTVAFFALTPVITFFLLKSGNSNVYLMIGFLTILPSLLNIINYETLRGMGQSAYYLFFSVCSVFLFTLIFLGLGYILFGDSSYVVVVSYTLAVWVSLFVSQVVVMKRFKGVPNVTIPDLRMKDILIKSYPFLLSNAMFVIINFFDTLILGNYVSKEELGVYSLICKLGNFVILPLNVLNSIYAPKIAQLFVKQDDELKTMAKKISMIIIGLTIPVVIVIFTFHNQLFTILNLQGFNYYTVLLVFCAGYLFSAFSGLNDSLLQMTGNEKIFQKIMIFATIISLGSNLILIPIFGILGAAISSTITLVFWNLLAIYYSKIRLGINTIFFLN